MGIQPLVAQEQPVVPSTAELKIPITEFLLEYQNKISLARAKNQSGMIGEIIHLFHNPKVQIVDDLEPVLDASLSVEDYIQKLVRLYPQGNHFSIDLDNIKIHKAQFDSFLERYIVPVWVEVHEPGFDGDPGKITSRIFRLAFNFYQSTVSDVVIFSIEYFYPKPQLLEIGLKPMLTRIYNRELSIDDRFELRWQPGFSGSVSLQKLVNDHWGFSLGLGLSVYNNLLILDQFDPYMGMDPYLEQVHFMNRIWTIDPSLMVNYWLLPDGNFRPYLSAGIISSVRFYETASTSATRTSSGDQVRNVISDPLWYDYLNRIHVRATLGAGVYIRLNHFWSLDLGIKADEGLTGLDHRSDPLYPVQKYTGQAQPLWSEPDHLSVVQCFYAHFGVAFMLND